MSIDLLQLVDGNWVTGSGEGLESRSPSRPGTVIASGAAATAIELDAAVAAATRAGLEWAALPAHARGAILTRAAGIVRSSAETWGAELAEEEGKTLAEGVGEVGRAAQILAYFGGDADRETGSLFNSPRAGERILVTRRPLGVIAVITPFNFPIAIPAWKIAPALAYGNTVVWKPADTVPLLAMRLAQALHAAGVPAGVLNLLIGDAGLGPSLVDHRGIDAISFTGSTAVGRAIAASGAARGIPVQAELGGKNAAVVLADADLDLAVAQIMAGAFNSTGQKCTATSRLIVEDAIADRFLDRLVLATRSLTIGDPLAVDVRLGPVISDRARSAITTGVARAVEQGARVLCSVEPTVTDDLADGYFVAPTILDCTDTDAELWTTELFGPVLAVRRVAGFDEAVDVLNASDFGLSASVFTNDLGLALAAIDRVVVGMLHINSETAGADPHVPFGGVKGSGLGPSEQGQAARDFYTQTMTVYLRGGL